PLGTVVSSAIVYRQPAGVCGLIPTWNFPLFVTVQKLGPALATGCTMVFKPSPYGPLINLLLAEIVAEADLPPGVVNFVTGESNAIAETLVSDPRIDKVSFTGSVATGKKILAAAAATLKRVHLELGGKSVAIFLDTDDLDVIAPQAASPAFFHAGQGCAMTTRVLVPREAHDHLVQKMVDFVRGVVKVGDPADPSTFLGPVIRDERRRKIEEYIESGKQEGAVLAHGGGRPKDLPHGYFLEPTIFCGVPNHIRIAQEEIFGPVVAVLPFRDADEAIRIANDSTYGLGGMIFSRDMARAIELAKRIRTGAVWINNGINLIDTPFGRFKESGIGRERGRLGMEEYTELQQISWRASSVALVAWPKPPANRRRTSCTEPLLPLRRVERIFPREEELEVREVVVPPEQLVPDLHRGHAEHASGNRVVRLAAKARLGFGPLRFRDERGSRETDFIAETLDHGRLADV